MSIAEKFEIIADEVYEKGKKDEYDKFWDIFQDYGKRTGYIGAFGGSVNSYNYWNDENFNPKYDFIFGESLYSCDNMFQYCAITDLEAILARKGLKFDTSKALRLSGTFDRSRITKIPDLDVTSSTSLSQTFYLAQYLIKVGLKNLSEDCTFKIAFQNCYALKDLEITGTIGQNGFNVQWSTKLSSESIVSIIEALSDTTSGLTVTLSQTAVDNMVFPITGNKGTYNSWTELEQTKTNWTISLV